MLAAALFSCVPAQAAPDAARTAQVIFLGERHDNPAHHEVQADWVRDLRPRALVFEMLSPAQAVAAADVDRRDAPTLALALDWDAGGWPDFAFYHPIFAAAPEALLVGAGIGRVALREMLDKDLGAIEGAERFGLDRALAPQEQEAREALQRAVHCDALPEDLLPRMVTAQRLRDMALARAALKAFDETGGPVVVITGNGHARRDWGAPALLLHAAPTLQIFALGQTEAGELLPGRYDFILDAPAVTRDDPCAELR
ncbi:ChaN family lipoprotein [Sulfitobacter aestuarii]|uniref:ChaN family lipoprotein n=1 Tax=Sulfitobacter aestuarii TaxID=2161676 RepID=A0ABW5U4Y8_9RHOB